MKTIMKIGPMTLEQQRKYVSDLRDEEDYHREIVSKYGSTMAKNSYERIFEISKLLQGYSNIHTLRDGDFAKFASGDFGFI